MTTMFIPWLWLIPLMAALSAGEPGSSLRGAVEALQRRQRGQMKGSVLPIPDYEALYEFIPPRYLEPDQVADVDDFEDDQSPKYVVKLLEDNEGPPETYEYKIIKKKNTHLSDSGIRKESAFRERAHHADNDRLKDLFAEQSDSENNNEVVEEKSENDAEYALLLGQLWSKYKNNNGHVKNVENAPQGVVKLYKDKIIKKRYLDNWGPIAFKRKRSADFYSDYDNEDPTAMTLDNLDPSLHIPIRYNDVDSVILTQNSNEIEKRFPVSKRSKRNNHEKRFAKSQNKYDRAKAFRSSAGTDPRIIKDLSNIFGDSDIEIIKNPVKRNADHEENSHEGTPPKVIMLTHNSTHDRNNSSQHYDDSHEHHGHNLHHPGISDKEVEHIHDHHHEANEKPITIKKKSIDWTDYFGIDKRAKKAVSFVNDVSQEKLRKQYFDTFNKEVIYPLNSFRRHTYVKRNYVQPKPSDETEIERAQTIAMPNSDNKADLAQDNDSKLDNIDKKLKTMEGIIVDEALHYTNVGEELDSKEEQEMKEKLLSRLAAAYSLEKMRKALKEFKQNLQTQGHDTSLKQSGETDDAKVKRVAVKKENDNDIEHNNEIQLLNKGLEKVDDFEDEQGAGHYLNGKNEQQFSEGYMGGSGRHRIPVMYTAGATGSCPVLSRIVQRCQGVDMLAGDRGQLFLPLCSLHQICYLCAEAPLTTCDLVFLSEADTTCEGDMGCQRAARSALMALRELHDTLADELDGECEASPCLPATLKLNIGWQRAFNQ